MSLQEEVFEKLVAAGRLMKADLWTENDLEILRQRARDLVGLQEKYQATDDPQKKAEYQLAAKLVVNHVQMLALTRLHVAQKHVAEALEALFWEVLIPKLGILLVGLLL